MASSDGSATAGVPAKTRRKAQLTRPSGPDGASGLTFTAGGRAGAGSGDENEAAGGGQGRPPAGETAGR